MLKRFSLVVISFCACSAAFAQSIDDRVRDLERRVERLEAQYLAQPASAPASPRVTSAEDGWKRLENWRAIRRGMTEADARSILGEPQRVNASGPITVWDYPPGGSEVRFFSGRVDGWREPTR